MSDVKYLVRWIAKTGVMQIYEVEPHVPTVFDGGSMGKTTCRMPDHCWHFNKGIAAVAESVGEAMHAIARMQVNAPLGT